MCGQSGITEQEQHYNLKKYQQQWKYYQEGQEDQKSNTVNVPGVGGGNALCNGIIFTRQNHINFGKNHKFCMQ